MAEGHGLAVDLQIAAARTVRTRKDVEQLVLALPLEGHDAKHFAGVQLNETPFSFVPEVRSRTTSRGSAPLRSWRGV